MTQEKQLEKIEKLFEMVSEEYVKPEEAEAIFDAILVLIEKTKSELSQNMANNMGEITDKHREMYSEMESMEARMKAMHAKMTDKLTGDNSKLKAQLLEEINLVKDLIPSIPSFKPLEDRIKEVEGKIPEMPKMPDLKPLEIKNEQLEEEIKDLKDKLQGLAELPRGRVGGARKTTSTKRINLTDQCNGVLKSFALPKDVIEVLGVWGTQFPITFDTADFTLTGNTLTLTSEVEPPATGQTLFALVTALFYG